MRVIFILLCGSLAVPAWAQSGFDVAMPRDARQTGGFPFANKCPTGQTFQVTSRPAVSWLGLEPATVDVAANSSFAVGVTVNTGKLPQGRYHSNVMIICTSCAASTPPCLQPAVELPVNLVVSDTQKTAQFTVVAPALQAAAPTARKHVAVVAAAPAPDYQRRNALIVFLCLLVGLIGTAVVLWRLVSKKKKRQLGAEGHPPAETERHQVRW